MVNKKGQFTDIFLFMIVSLIILVISGMFIYMAITVQGELHSIFSNKTMGSGKVNYTQVSDSVFNDLVTAYKTLYWSSLILMIGMILSIFIGSYLVVTKPIFFVPYIFIMIIAVFVSVGISNAYQTIVAQATMTAIFAGFVGANYIMFYLPLWVTIIGFTGAIIMFARMRSAEASMGYQ